MKNHFTIEVNGKRTKVFNTVLSAFDHWKRGYAFADYLSVFSGENRLDKRTEVIAYNDDVLNGELYATYRVYLNESEFPYMIDKIGLAPSIGGELSNQCTVSLPAASAVIFASIYLEPEMSDVSLYPGKNALVRSLLGMEPKPEFSVYGGNAVLPNRPIKCDTSSYDKLTATEISGGVKFSRGTKSDFAIGDPPFLRYNAAYSNESITTKARTATDGGVYLSGTVNAMGVRIGNEDVPFGCISVASKFHPTGKNYYDVLDSFTLISDPLGKYAGLFKDGLFYMIGDDGELIKRSCYNEPILCSDGTLVSKFGDTVYFTYLNGEQKSADMAFGEYVALSRDGGYDVFIYDAGNLRLYRFDGTLDAKTSFDVGENCKISRLSDFAVAVGNGRKIRLFMANGEIASYSSLTTHAITDEVIDGCFYGKTYMGNLYTGKSIACTSAYGRFCNTAKGLYYMGENGSFKVGDFTIEGAAIKDDTAYFLTEGRLTSYVMEKAGTFLSVNTEGEVLCDEVTVSATGETITVKIGEKEGV